MKSTKVANDLEILSRILDSKFRGPFGIKFGLDSIIGLIPGFGDTVSLMFGLYIIVRAAFLGASIPVILKMLLNTLIDYVVGLVPLFGDLFDLYFKSNERNYKMVRKHITQPKKTKSLSILHLVLVGLLLLFVLMIPVILIILTLKLIF